MTSSSTTPPADTRQQAAEARSLARLVRAYVATPSLFPNGVWRLRNEPAVYVLGGKVKHGFSTWTPAEARLLASALLAAADVAEEQQP